MNMGELRKPRSLKIIHPTTLDSQEPLIIPEFKTTFDAQESVQPICKGIGMSQSSKHSQKDKFLSMGYISARTQASLLI